jgi:Tfp pilus assembly protein PilF
VLPTDGGKVLGAIEKSTGKEFIYRNEVMKYRNISMRGPWTSGGIELNFGYIGHNPSTCVPVDYKTVENSDGSVSCIVGSLDLPSRTKWCVEIRVPKDRAYFETRTFWNNPTPLNQSYYNWMTGAAVVTDDLEFFYPGNQEIGHGGEHGLWPVNEAGRNVAMYKNNNFESSKSYHVVGEFNDFMGGYYHNSDFGFGHWALYEEMPGHKLWLWSLARDGGIWEDLLTDTDGQYMEFQAGRLHNQYGGSSNKTPISQIPFTPGLTDKWTEIWFPVKQIGGISDVSPFGALYAKAGDGKLNFGINSFAFAEGRITIRSNGREIFSEDKKFKPMEVFINSVPLASGADYEITVDGMDLQYNPSKRKYLSRPFISKMPTDKVTPSSVYQEGMELKENRNFRGAKVLLKKCLQMDPLYTDAMASLAEIYYRSNLYDSSLYYANNALQMDTYHPAANFFAGLAYKSKDNMTDALESLGWAARSIGYRSSAYALMAGIELQLGDMPLTEHYGKLALDFERNNFNALEILAIMYRKAGESGKADEYLNTISTLDPLSHFADFERCLLHPSTANDVLFKSTITNEMPYQTFLELAMIYYDLGLKDDALLVLDKAPSHPLVTIWKAYLKNDISLLAEAAAVSPAFVFPYRTETVSALNWALSNNSSWKFKYYLALNYAAIQRDAESMELFRACGQEPDYAPFYLTRASLLRPKDDNQILSDLLSAQKLTPDDWRTALKLMDYYEGHNDYKSALLIATNAYKKHKENSNVGIRYAQALINNGQYANSLKTLESMNILPNEGARIGKEVYEQSGMFLATDLMKKKKYGEAIKMIEKSKEWPENLGVGKPYEVDTRLQDYLKIKCLEKLNRKNEATDLKKAVIDYTTQHLSSPSFGNLAALNLLKEQGETGAVNDLIQKISNSSRAENPVSRWIIATANNDQTTAGKLESRLAGNRDFLLMKKIEEVLK